MYLLGIVFTILLGTYFYLSCCSSCGTSVLAETPVQEKIETEVVPKVTSYPFTFSNGDYSYNNHDNINFDLSDYSILKPISPKVDAGIFSLKKHLDTNKDKIIAITGFYKNDEENGSAFPNLGLARANSVKNYFVSKGMSSAKINILGELHDEMIPENLVLLGPLKYDIGDKAENTDAEMNALATKINDNPLVLYFNTGEAYITLTQEQRQKIADISKYLDKVDDASCSIVGHSDNTGNRQSNIILGKERAIFAKGYLIKNGIKESDIKTSSKGPNDPIAPNTTKEGRAKNRRTVVTLN